MRHGYPEEGAPFDPAWIAPLHAVAHALANSTRIVDSFFDPDDFMFMGWYQRTKRSRIMLYKHRDTRRYLNVDETGQTYRYVVPKSDDDRDEGTYRRYSSLQVAVDRVGLWELPWMRSELEHHQRGVSWEDRAELFLLLTAEWPRDASLATVIPFPRSRRARAHASRRGGADEQPAG